MNLLHSKIFSTRRCNDSQFFLYFSKLGEVVYGKITIIIIVNYLTSELSKFKENLQLFSYAHNIFSLKRGIRVLLITSLIVYIKWKLLKSQVFSYLSIQYYCVRLLIPISEWYPDNWIGTLSQIQSQGHTDHRM